MCVASYAFRLGHFTHFEPGFGQQREKLGISCTISRPGSEFGQQLGSLPVPSPGGKLRGKCGGGTMCRMLVQIVADQHIRLIILAG